ncbi:hypothetical protein [Streptomyces sp. ODS28]|uniref:hypothetical protein n=1 Tax=Streptomyces sp. ODS28 TaxID=3136688 RepID=UPI0031E8902F
MTPDVVSRLRSGLNADELAAVETLDRRRLELERSRVPAKTAAHITEPLYGVFACLKMWQRLVRDMEEEWSRTSSYMVYEYLNDLTVRDSIDEYLAAMPPSLQEKVEHIVSDLDGRYQAVTVEDGGAELALYRSRLAGGREICWWWARKSRVFPPGW